MVATLEATDGRVRKRLREHADVRERDGLIVAAVIEIKWRLLRKQAGQLSRRPQVVARPTAVTDERRRNQEDAMGRRSRFPSAR